VCVDGEGRLYQDFYKMVLEDESRTDTPDATGACRATTRACMRGLDSAVRACARHVYCPRLTDWLIGSPPIPPPIPDSLIPTSPFQASC
jgi:hypothetical protein